MPLYRNTIMEHALDPTNTSDNLTFQRIRDTGHISADNQKIFDTLGYAIAESKLLESLPELALPDGRTNAKRERGLIALAALTVAYLIEFGGRTASGHSDSDITTTGELKKSSMTIGPVSTSNEYHQGTSHVISNRQTEVTVDHSADELKAAGIEILEALGGKTSHIIAQGTAELTAFVESLASDCLPTGGSQQQSQVPQKQAPTGEGAFPYISGDE